MNDQELLELGPMEAQKQLDDEKLQRYNELKEENLKEDLKEKKQEDEAAKAEGLEGMRQQAEEELTVTIHGVEFLADLGPKQFHKLNQAAKFEDKKASQLSESELEEVRSNILDVFADLSINKDREDFEKHFGDAGLATIGKISQPLLNKIKDATEQKKSR